jgi:hypothetical protein
MACLPPGPHLQRHHPRHLNHRQAVEASESESIKSRVPCHAGWGSRFSRSGDSDEPSFPVREPRRGRTFLVASSDEDEDGGGAGERQSLADLSCPSRRSGKACERGIGGAPIDSCGWAAAYSSQVKRSVESPSMAARCAASASSCVANGGMPPSAGRGAFRK